MRLLIIHAGLNALLLVFTGLQLRADGLEIVTLSAHPDKVSGDDVLVRINVPGGASPDSITIRRNGDDITSAFRPDPAGNALLALVEGLRPGQNWLEASAASGLSARLSILNFPITGPIFSGPHQKPFVCETETFKLPDGTTLGPPLDDDCSVKTRVTYVYKTSTDAVRPLESMGSLPPDIAWTTTSTGQRVPYLVRIETGTINRGIYQFAVLHDPSSEAAPSPVAPPKAWNRRLLYSFGGGCVGGWYRQGSRVGSVMNDEIVGRGYAEAVSTLNVFGNNCQDVTAAETMMMVKERFIEAYGSPLFTFGRGGSGGSYQQLQIADNYPGLLDGIIPSATFPDVLETTQFLVDAQLLDRYFAGEGSLLSDEKKLAISGTGLQNVKGTAASAGRINPSAFCPVELPPALRYDPLINRAGARCDIFDHTANVYGRDPATGFARRAIDNTGVQYGLAALNAQKITAEEFLQLNERIGGYDNDGNLSDARASADIDALRAAYRTGRVTNGGAGLATVPIIDFREYTDQTERGDVHLKYHSFSLRERLRAANGNADNSVMLVAAAKVPSSRQAQSYAIEKMDEWLTNISRDTVAGPASEKIKRARPQDLVDSCYTATGERITEPQRFSEGECHNTYPAFPPPRMVAGGPSANNVLKCSLKPIDFADYTVPFSPQERERLAGIFPQGVCDWSRPGIEQQKLIGTWLRY